MNSINKQKQRIRRLKKVSGERCLYQDSRSGVYYIRIQKDGFDTYKSLETTQKRKALEGLDARRNAKIAAKFGLAIDPDEAAQQCQTVVEVIKYWEQNNYPDRHGNARTEGLYLSAQVEYCDTLLTFFKQHGTLVSALGPKMLNQYHAWRVGNVTRGQGHRTTDLELTALSAALDYAVEQEQIASNPIKQRKRFHNSKNVNHCRKYRPEDVDELHSVAAILFESRHKESLGWQALCEAMTGLRTNEALALRTDARADEPGGISEDGETLCVRRSKTTRTESPFIEVHNGLRSFLNAHAIWKRLRFPESPWYFPGRDHEGAKPVYAGSLTNALRFLFRGGKVPKQIKSHGMRAFYVWVRRSQGISDTQIAWEINHVGGVSTLEKVYGTPAQHWGKRKAAKVSWLPKGNPGWVELLNRLQVEARAAKQQAKRNTKK